MEADTTLLGREMKTKLARCCVAVGILLFSSCLGISLIPDNPNSAKVLALKVSLQEAKTSEAAGEALKEIFDRVGRKGLEVLMDDADTTLALQAAWEHYLGPGTKAVTPRPEEFVSFLERRIGLEAPLRWQYSIVSYGFASWPGPDSVRRGAKEKYLPRCDFLRRNGERGDIDYVKQEFAGTDFDFSAPAGTTIRRVNGNVVFQVGNATLSVRESDFVKLEGWNKLQGDGRRCSASIGPERSFIAFCDDIGMGLFLACFDSQSGALLWQRTGWATGSDVPLLGERIGFHEVMFVQTKSRVNLFGNSNFGEYVDGFDINNGAHVFHFSTRWLEEGTDAVNRWRRNLRR